MLLANRHVAHFIGSRKERPRQRHLRSFYRIHDKPNEEKYQDFRTFASKFGYTIKEASSERGIARELNRFLGKIKRARKRKTCSPYWRYAPWRKPSTHGQHRALRSCVRLLHPLHLAHPPLPRHDGAPSVATLSRRRQIGRQGVLRRSLQTLVGTRN